MFSKRTSILLLVFLAVFVCITASISVPQRTEKQIIDNILSRAGNDPRIRPPGLNKTDDGVEVTINMYVRAIHRVDDEKQMLGMEVVFRSEWVDKRLEYNSMGDAYVTLEDDDSIWTPDIFFNDYRGNTHDITRTNMLVRIYPDGSVLHSKRYNLVIYCPMAFQTFPFDTQTCDLKIESYAYQAKEVYFRWKNIEKPIYIGDNAHENGLFTLTGVTTNSGTTKAKSGNYSYLSALWEFQRNLHYYMIEFYIPLMMLSICAYGVFWINHKSLTSRLLLAGTTLFTTFISCHMFNVDSPRVSYNKASDIYSGITLTFIFATLAETLIVHVLEEKQQKKRGSACGDSSDEKMPITENGSTKLNQMTKWMMKSHSTSEIDAIARVLYPVLFAAFQVIYWGVCLSF